MQQTSYTYTLDIIYIAGMKTVYFLDSLFAICKWPQSTFNSLQTDKIL